MKKILSFVAVVLVVAMMSMLFVGCTFKDYATNESENIFEGATYTDLDGGKVKLSTKQDKGDGIIVNLAKEETFNTIILGEKNSGLKSNIIDFSLSYFDKAKGEYVNFYNQDLVEEYRYCVFNDITTDKIKLVVNNTEEGRAWNLKRFEGYNIAKTASSDFRVMGYAVRGYAYEGVKDPDIFKTVTHINVFQHLFLQANGDILFSRDKLNDKDVDGKEVFKKELENIVEAAGDRDVKIIATILPEPGNDPEALHTPAFNDHGDKVIARINELFDEFPALDGVAFDYEYPYSGKANKVFGDFVIKLKKSIPEGKLLALALSSWQFKVGLFPHKALEYVDMVEMMAYDQFDERGYHSTFQNSMVNIVNELSKLGLDKYLGKINLGVPFYSRPTDGSLYWGDYILDAKVIGHDKNIITEPDMSNGRKVEAVLDWATMETTPVTKPLYYNSPQMIFDKTAYAVDNKLGGIMIWHLGCDTEYNGGASLLKAIQDAIDMRS